MLIKNPEQHSTIFRKICLKTYKDDKMDLETVERRRTIGRG